MGAKQPKVPKPTAAELELQQMQLNMLRAQQRDINLMRPYLLQSMRMKQVGKGKDMKFVKMTDDEYKASLSLDERKQYENLLLAQDRETKALKGELPLTAEGQAQKADEFNQLKEAMARKGTPITGDTPSGATGSDTAGIQSLAAFNRSWGAREEAERRGELDSGAQMVLNRLGTASGLENANYTRGTNMAGAFYTPFQAGVSQAIDPYIRRAQMGTDASIAGARLSQANTQFWANFGMDAAQMFAGGMGGYYSTKSKNEGGKDSPFAGFLLGLRGRN